MPSSGAGLSARTEPSVEVLQRLLESDLGRIKFAHRGGQAVLGEVVRVDLAPAAISSMARIEGLSCPLASMLMWAWVMPLPSSRRVASARPR